MTTAVNSFDHLHTDIRRRRRSRRLLGLLAGALAATCVAAPAQAEPILHAIYTYDATIEGTAEYHHLGGQPGGSTDRSKARFSFKTEAPGLNISKDEKNVLVYGAAGIHPSGSIHDASFVGITKGPGGEDVTTCEGGVFETGAPAPGFVAWWDRGPDLVARAAVRVFSDTEIQLPNCNKPLASARIRLFSGGAEPGKGPLDQVFEMPYEAVGNGKIIQLVDKTVTGADCPGRRPDTISCELKWNATITMDLKGQAVEVITDDDLFVPLTPEEDEDTTDDAPVTPAEANLAPGATQASVAITCPSGCSGVAAATPAKRGAGAARRTKALARKRFKAAPGKKTRVTLRFSARARKAIKRAGGVRIDLRVTPTGGKQERRSLTLRLKRRRS